MRNIGLDQFKMRINLVDLRAFLLVVSLVFLSGAAELPGYEPFRMKEFDDARNQSDFTVPIPEVLDVNPVSQRYDGSAELARLPVEGVIVEGVVPYPELGITQAEIQAVVDEKFSAEQAIERDENGFTKRDIRDVGAFLREIIDRGGYDQEDLDNLVNLVRTGEQTNGWINIEQLDAIALTVTEYYRERGFILATAFVPEQEVTDGIIRLSVLEGRLGGVTVSDNDIFSDKTISSAFNNDIGEPVTEERIESALRRINDLPGVRVRGSFSPGENVGETNLNLGVLEEKSWSSNVLVDNHGSETTGETRIYATSQWLNVAGRGHRLLLGALRSEGPDSSLYGVVEYELPVTQDGRGRVRGNLSTNTFTVGATQGVPEIVGETDNYSVAGTYQFTRSRTKKLSAQVAYTYKDVLFQVAGAAQLSTDQQLEVLSVSTDYTSLWDDQQLLLSGRLGVDQGHIIKGEVPNQSTDYTKLLGNMNLLKRVSFYNWLTKDESSFNVVFKSNAQYSEKFLSAVEQFSMGGPGAVRAFSVSDISVDSGIYAGLEMSFGLPFDLVGSMNLPLDPIKPYVFFDYAYGVARRPGGGDDKDAQIKGYGLGMRLNWAGRGAANFVFATPLSSSYDDNFTDAEGKSRVYIDVNYQVH